jgi:hypothetical protein
MGDTVRLDACQVGVKQHLRPAPGIGGRHS